MFSRLLLIAVIGTANTNLPTIVFSASHLLTLNDIRRNGRVRIPLNPLLHKDNENSGKTRSEQTFSEPWTLTNLAAIQRVLIQEKQVNLSQNGEFCGALTCSISVPRSPSLLEP